MSPSPPPTTSRSSATEGALSVWDTSSDKDRILEQIKYIPISFKQSTSLQHRPRVILVSNSPESWGKKRGNVSFMEDECLVQNCVLVGGEYKKKVDVVIFHTSLADIDDYATNIDEDTVKILFVLESPYVSDNYSKNEGYINWTATYRRDSTIVAPYEKFDLFPNSSQVVNLKKHYPKNFASGKTKMAAIFISNCRGANRRMDIVQELQKYITVDVYGQCGNLECPRTSSEECFKLLNEDYKFYLAFENANCRDYITEKFFVNGLRNDVIPVVMGAHPDDYRKVSPPHSYIHVEDFPTIRALAEYMKELDQNDNKYNEYFQWKGTGSFIDTKFFCRICSLVNDDNKPRLVVDNLEEWWHSKDVCRPGPWLVTH
ncbi:glycoprotein 3-alpha-L-fucosyltransferase A-like [Gigantopelta aegis]|uniref:glycoprotein 3-alpha-L-fucosyltransferase A-like n=1 Tax=Gigantopelta aegis TaxID=1735272 RepID=UPI001B88C232|nr:glycoprotein 3-alpha-L-fucosyltransferase A-like [Gigantopelta aegis]